MTLYMATVLPGLEYILEHEIAAKIGDAAITQTTRGKVFFTSRQSVRQLQTLRTADNLYRFLHRFRVGPHKIHLQQIAKDLSALDWSRATGENRAVRSCVVNASRTGKHTYSRHEAAEAALQGVLASCAPFRAGTPELHDVEFRLDIKDDDAVFLLRLTDALFRYRSQSRAFAPAALRPTVAHALVWLSEPEAGDLFVDPCCGSGTIIAERLAYAARQVIGGDLSAEAVDAALSNTGGHERASVRQWDARRLPLDAGCVDKLVANLPFGRQIAADADLTELYREMIREMGRVVKRNGTILCLTEAAEPLERAAERFSLSCRKEVTLSLKGLLPTLYILKKR